MLTRRQFLKVSLLTGAALFVPKVWASSAPSRRGRGHGRKHHPPGEPLPGGTLDPLTIPKYATPLVIPPALPRLSEVSGPQGEPVDYYEIAVRQFSQHVLPESMGINPTTLWGYVAVQEPGTLNYPAFTINATAGKPVRVKWINDLKDPETGEFLPHLLPVDQTVHWANPPGGEHHRDHETQNPALYTGPVPIVVHLHGGHTPEESDGYAEAWYLPAASNLPAGYAQMGTFYDEFKTKAERRYGQAWEPGTAVFQYPNDQRAATMWVHDHALGITRLNVYAGPAGFYLLRGGPDDLAEGVLPGPAPQEGDAGGTKYYEIPIAIQDRSFNDDGSLFYPASREFFDGFTGPYVPDSDISPIWNPEFFGNTMVVNGKTWPYLEVEPRRYRFRLLNGCNSRFLILQMNAYDSGMNPKTPPTFWQIGSDGGFLPAAVEMSDMLLGPAERADTIVDFTGFQVGDIIRLINVGPDEPFGGGTPGVNFTSADMDTTGQVMEFRVVPLASVDTSTPPGQLQLPKIRALDPPVRTRKVSLNELDSSILSDVGPQSALLGTVSVEGVGVPMKWMDELTETPVEGDVEIWEIYNYTADAHPMHIHEVMFEVVDREIFDPAVGTPGTIIPAPDREKGHKDTVIAYPGEVTRIKAKFDLPGLYVWHCHILEHEDHEMMRPYRVLHRIDLLNLHNESGA